MKTKSTLTVVAFVTTIAVAGWNIWNTSNIETNQLMLENVEALSTIEVQTTVPCYPYPSTCYVNIRDLWGNVIPASIQGEIKAAPFQ